ncbi:uncharacterized protein LOC144133126 isoform X1 [Amblyomma americanum]
MADISPDHDYVFNIVLVGDSGVGKSCLLEFFCGEEQRKDEGNAARLGSHGAVELPLEVGREITKPNLREGTQGTDGQGQGSCRQETSVNFTLKTIKLDGHTIKLQIWTTAKDTGVLDITARYSKRPHGIILMYDVTDQESFRSVHQWFHQFGNYASKDVSIILVGNKSDLANWRMVHYATAEDLAGRLHIQYVETSALHGTNVEELFLTMAAEIKSRVGPSLTSTKRRKSDIQVIKAKGYHFKGYIFKIILIGSSSVGKSSLANRIWMLEEGADGKQKHCGGFWHLSSSAAYIEFKRIVLDGETMTVQLCEARDGFGDTRASYCWDAHGIIAIYDITDTVSFEYAKHWLQDIKRSGCQNIVTALVGNKSDLQAEKTVDDAVARELAEQLDIPLFQTSAKSGANVNQTLQKIIVQMKNSFCHPDTPIQGASSDDKVLSNMLHESCNSSGSDHMFTLLLLSQYCVEMQFLPNS